MGVWSEKLIWPLIKWSHFSGTITYLSIIFWFKKKKLAIILTDMKGQNTRFSAFTSSCRQWNGKMSGPYNLQPLTYYRLWLLQAQGG